VLDEAEDLAALREAVRDLLAKRSDGAAVRAAAASARGYDADLWDTLAGMGVAGLALPEAHGGAGAGLAAAAVVAEELGRTLTPAPFLGSAVLAGQLLLALDDDAAAARLLPRLAAGEVAAVCWSAADGTWDQPPITAREGRLTGTAHYVLDGDTADVLLAVAREGEDVAVYEAEPGLAQRVHAPAMDLTRRLATVTFDDVPAARLGAGSARTALEAARQAALAVLAAEQVGAAETALRRTVEYAKVREQFGRPIGSFQALKHRMADVHVCVTSARSAALAAAAGGFDPVAAAVVCGEALQAAAAEMIQLHGGIAITWEHDAHLFFKRAHGAARLFGTPAARMSELAGRAGVTP
jgi:alkylation response protein AidB-like acyl-CoA dehydrogenase